MMDRLRCARVLHNMLMLLSIRTTKSVLHAACGLPVFNGKGRSALVYVSLDKSTFVNMRVKVIRNFPVKANYFQLIALSVNSV